MADNSFSSTVASLFKGMDSFITTKTVVGDAVHIGDTIILPLVDVSFGVGAGAFSDEKKNNGGGGMGGKITPSAVLVIQNGTGGLEHPAQHIHAVFGAVEVLRELIATATGILDFNIPPAVDVDFLDSLPEDVLG